MRKILVLFLLHLTMGMCAAADMDQAVWQHTAAEARSAYDQGDYKEAIRKYLILKNSGLKSAELYYNLGNAEFKSGHVGRAIAYYRQASKRAPGDNDIQYNLEYARSKVAQPEDKTGVLGKLFTSLFYRFQGQDLALAAWIAYVGFCAVLAVLIWQRGKPLLWRWVVTITGAIFLLIAAWASLRIVTERSIRWGVIIVNQAEARNGPGEENQVGFTVPEGREVRILGREKEWKAIGLSPEGYKGWIHAKDVWEDE